ncbi:MAG TPA: GNAT family N-acetyltransferase [Candidatus Pelethenecus sp.]|nr:GNAT family N-acetyltransferase [Candidatus Pelethenecus sp.]
MKIEFKKFNEFERGILYHQLLNAYSFSSECCHAWEKDWLEYDNYFFDHLCYTNNCGFVIMLDGTPIGHISWDPRNLPDYVILGHNCILTEYKGNGFGHLLLEEAIRRIRAYEGIKKIIVTTNEITIPAQHNYLSVGFKLKKRRKNSEYPFAGDYLDYELNLT